MRRFSRRMMVAGVLAAAAMEVSAGGLRAEEKPIPFLRASFMPDAAQKFVDDLGLPVPLTREMKREVERAPFMGAGSIASEKPLGIIVFATGIKEGEGIEDLGERSFVIALPVNKGFATVGKVLAAVKEMDDGAVAKGGDTVVSEHVVLRRLTDYVMVSKGPLVEHMADAPFKDDYKKAGTLGSAVLDLAGIRKGYPKEVEALWKEIASNARSGKPGENEVAQKTVKFLREKFDSIDTISATVSHDEKVLRTGVTVTPCNIKLTGAVLPRPAFPGGTIFQAHVAYPTAAAASWIVDALGMVDFKVVADDGRHTADEIEQAKGIMERTVKLMLAPDAQSIGVTVDAGMPLVMVVNQYHKPVNFDREVRSITSEINEMARKRREPQLFEVSDYMVGTRKVTRLMVLNRERAVGYVDYAQAGNRVVMTISPEKVKQAADILALPSKAQLTEFLSASLDLGAAFAAAKETMPIPDDMVKGMEKSLADKSVTLVVKSSDDGKSMVIETAVPLEVLKEMGKALSPMMPEDEPAEPGAVEPAEPGAMEPAEPVTEPAEPQEPEEPEEPERPMR